MKKVNNLELDSFRAQRLRAWLLFLAALVYSHRALYLQGARRLLAKWNYNYKLCNSECNSYYCFSVY